VGGGHLHLVKVLLLISLGLHLIDVKVGANLDQGLLLPRGEGLLLRKEVLLQLFR
jgi:hypothetical protein